MPVPSIHVRVGHRLPVSSEFIDGETLTVRGSFSAST